MTIRIPRSDMKHARAPFHGKRITIALLSAAAALISTFLFGQSQPGEIKGTIEGTAIRRVPIAVAPVVPGGGQEAIAREIRQVIADDLTFAGYFDVVDPSRYNGLNSPALGSPDLKPWKAIGAEAVLASRLLSQGSSVVLEGRLYDAASSEMVLGKRYAGEPDLARRIAHRLSNDIIQHFTGQPGVALSRIGFVSQHGSGKSAGKELYIMDYDGYGLKRITTSGTINLSPAWSPDGGRLAYLSFRKKFPAIYIWNLAQGNITSLPTAGGDLNSAPDWSPDGARIAYSSTRDGNCEIYVMDGVLTLDGSSRRERRLTFDRAIDSSPSWSPTGREIAFTSDRGGSPQIYVMDADGGNVRRLTFDGRRSDSAAWSPKGDRIAHVSRIDGKFALMILDLGTQKSSTLLSGSFNCEDPRWSADGRHIVFASDRSGSYQIYTVDADGSNLRQLTRGPASFTPDWSR